MFAKAVLKFFGNALYSMCTRTKVVVCFVLCVNGRASLNWLPQIQTNQYVGIV